MNTTRGRLNKVLRFSTVDGPGNRFVIFVQGCNFNCVNCHNPYTITDCNHCGLCVDPCPEHALTVESGPLVVVDREACTACDICIDICPFDATPLAYEASIDELVDQIRETSKFISGITVSGGEATLQPEFLIELFTAVKTDPALAHLTTFVDTNGSAPPDVWDRLAPVMDGAMVDLKALDEMTHIRLTAASNTRVLDSIRHLAELRRLHEVRLLIMAGYNDDDASIDRTITWLRDVDPTMRIVAISFRNNGVRPGFEYLVESNPERMAAIGDRIRAAGFADVVVV
ncbi:MAG TPA: YjjW family glycine radical enzyme activase [Acidimicrobiia bacterium]|nr:YjjW family glycine radical enzyme activase [Acidimicrobiia bacterium]